MLLILLKIITKLIPHNPYPILYKVLSVNHNQTSYYFPDNVILHLDGVLYYHIVDLFKVIVSYILNNNLLQWSS